MPHTKRAIVPLLALLTGGAMLWLLAQAAGPAAAQGNAPAKHLRFSISLAPVDPFANTNQAGGGEKEKPFSPRRGEEVMLVIQGQPTPPGWYTYPVSKLAPGQPKGQLARLDLLTPDFAPLGQAVEVTEPKLADGPTPDEKQYKYTGPFTWTMPLIVRPDATPGKPAKLELRIRAQVCEKLCVNETHTLTLEVPIAAGEADAVSGSQQKAIQDHQAALAKTSTPRAPTAPNQQQGTAPTTVPGPSAAGTFDWRELTVIDVEGAIGGDATARASGLLGVIITAVIGGLLSLVTPCVFPMIPITVSFFLKQSEKSSSGGGGKALLMAAVYSGTLVLVLTAGGVALGSVLQTVSQHWATNTFLTFVFVFFGLSLLGAYEIQLPSWLADATSSREGQGGMLGVVFMALTFSIISFACVGPIYGGFTALSASGASAVEGWTQRIAGPLAFSVAFASPFFVLALFPQLLKKMPKGGGWMNVIKVVMGFLELAAAFKFVRAAEVSFLNGRTDYFTFDVVLCVYIALCVACALYLFNVYRLPHDYEPVEMISVPRLVFGLIFVTLAFYLLPGTFKDEKGHAQKPRGVSYEWVRAFLLPDEAGEWGADLPAAMAQAERENKPLFIDFTGQTCNNCKLNESRIFSQARVKQVFSRFVTLSLYTDTVPAGLVQVPDPDGATGLRDEKFKNIALPYYVVVHPKGKVLYRVASYTQGLIDNADEFAAFLEQAEKVKWQ